MRYVLVIVGLLLIVGGLGFVKFSQISSLMAMGEQMQKAGPPPESVGTAVAEGQEWEDTLSAVGSIASVQGVALSTEAAGVVTKISFDSGSTVKQGKVLVELDTSVERAQLASARARRDLAKVTAERSRALVASRVISQAQMDAAEAELKTASTEYSAIQAQIARKVVRAPFTGRLGIREVNLGQYLNPGTPITVLESSGALFVDFTLPQQRLGMVSVGMPVRVTLEGSKGQEMAGAIAAVEPTVDNNTRAVKLRASVPNDQAKLRSGMFVNVSVILPEKNKLVIVPATAVVHASYGDSVFIVEPKKPGSPGMAKTPDGKEIKMARQQFVRLGEARGDFAAILDGVKSGQVVVSAGAFKLRNGVPIVVNNAIGPKPSLNPRPENR
ncbi:MAG TPA: efflux RND transporter periplasmic adaptor subunit [Polyangiaceae bacterium]|nr:efflux RND transporter periplasmic adaptor subunit [Polyangiaceae bacterium]